MWLKAPGQEDASADVILLLDPSGQNNFAVNQAWRTLTLSPKP